MYLNLIELPMFSIQDQLEEVLDVVLANQRFIFAERHAQRKFLVHSLHSLNDLISDTFASTSSHLDGWFAHIQRFVPAYCLTMLSLFFFLSSKHVFHAFFSIFY